MSYTSSEPQLCTDLGAPQGWALDPHTQSVSYCLAAPGSHHELYLDSGHTIEKVHPLPSKDEKTLKTHMNLLLCSCGEGADPQS